MTNDFDFDYDWKGKTRYPPPVIPDDSEDDDEDMYMSDRPENQEDVPSCNESEEDDNLENLPVNKLQERLASEVNHSY